MRMMMKKSSWCVISTGIDWSKSQQRCVKGSARVGSFSRAKTERESEEYRAVCKCAMPTTQPQQQPQQEEVSFWFVGTVANDPDSIRGSGGWLLLQTRRRRRDFLQTVQTRQPQWTMFVLFVALSLSHAILLGGHFVSWLLYCVSGPSTLGRVFQTQKGAATIILLRLLARTTRACVRSWLVFLFRRLSLSAQRSLDIEMTVDYVVDVAGPARHWTTVLRKDPVTLVVAVRLLGQGVKVPFYCIKLFNHNCQP